MKEIDPKALIDLAKKVEEVGRLLRRYFDEQTAKKEKSLLANFTHGEKMAYLDGKGAARDSSSRFF